VIKYDTVLKDTNGMYSASTGQVIIPVTGNWDISVFTTAAGTLSSYLVVNGTSYPYINNVTGAGASAGGMITLPFNAGDIVSVFIDTSRALLGTAGQRYLCYASFSRRSGPAVITATESVNMSYNTSATSISGSLATVTYSNKIRDSHNQYASGSYTIPVSGTYLAQAAIAVSGTIALNNTLDLQIQQTGSASQIAEQKVYAGGAETALSALAGDLFYCLAGDVIKVQVSSSVTGPTVVSSASQNYLSIYRVGN
jgi:hypothetical protein